MNYLLLEIIVYLSIAGLMGFVLGWIVKGSKNKTVTTEIATKAIEKKAETRVESTSQELEEEEKKIEDSKKITLSCMATLTQAREEGKDELTLIKGVGPILEKKLNNLGIYHFDQIAVWTIEEQALISLELLFPKKVEREKWVEQSKELMKA